MSKKLTLSLYGESKYEVRFPTNVAQKLYAEFCDKCMEVDKILRDNEPEKPYGMPERVLSVPKPVVGEFKTEEVTDRVNVVSSDHNKRIAADIPYKHPAFKGFMYIQCPKCGKKYAYFKHSFDEFFVCQECSLEFPFCDMDIVRILVPSHDSKRDKVFYFTNIDSVVEKDFPCLDGHYYTLMYNPVTKKYVPIEESVGGV